VTEEVQNSTATAGVIAQVLQQAAVITLLLLDFTLAYWTVTSNSCQDPKLGAQTTRPWLQTGVRPRIPVPLSHCLPPQACRCLVRGAVVLTSGPSDSPKCVFLATVITASCEQNGAKLRGMQEGGNVTNRGRRRGNRSIEVLCLASVWQKEALKSCYRKVLHWSAQPVVGKCGRSPIRPGVRRPGRGVNHPPTSSAEVKERVKLYLFSPPVFSWHVIGRTLPALHLCEARGSHGG
jgi:hypothetical protein